MSLILDLRDLVVLKFSRDGDGIHGGYMGIEALNYWKEIMNAKAWL